MVWAEILVKLVLFGAPNAFILMDQLDGFFAA